MRGLQSSLVMSRNLKDRAYCERTADLTLTSYLSRQMSLQEDWILTTSTSSYSTPCATLTRLCIELAEQEELARLASTLPSQRNTTLSSSKSSKMT